VEKVEKTKGKKAAKAEGTFLLLRNRDYASPEQVMRFDVQS
jgi:hypothetical protein